MGVTLKGFALIFAYQESKQSRSLARFELHAEGALTVKNLQTASQNNRALL